MNHDWMIARRRAPALVLFVAAFFAFITGAAQEKSQCNVKVTLLQVNDVYQFAPVDQGKAGGLGRVLTLQKIDPAAKPKHIITDGRRHYLTVSRVDHLQGRADDRSVECDRSRLRDLRQS